MTRFLRDLSRRFTVLPATVEHRKTVWKERCDDIAQKSLPRLVAYDPSAGNRHAQIEFSSIIFFSTDDCRGSRCGIGLLCEPIATDRQYQSDRQQHQFHSYGQCDVSPAIKSRAC